MGYCKHFLTVISLVLLTATCLATDGFVVLEQSRNRLRLSVESVPVSPAEQMGLLGIHLDHYLTAHSPFYFGIGGYGAFSGQRGGFFTAGLSIGSEFTLSGLTLDGRLFAGGGGGSSAFPGSGRMLRPSLALTAATPLGELAAEICHETISEKNLGYALSASLQYQLMLLEKAVHPLALNAPNPVQVIPVTLIASTGIYFPEPGTRYTSGERIPGPIPLLSVDLTIPLWKYLQLSTALYGGGGDADGYGKILSGLKQDLPLAEHTALFAQLQAGMSGGGGVDTGGGIIVQPALGIETRFEGLLLQAKLARTMALAGGFQATTLSLGGGTTLNLLAPSETAPTRFSVPETTADFLPLFTSVTHKTYTPAPTLLSKSGHPYQKAIHLLGFSAALPVFRPFYLQASTYWAWDGNIGAYAEGNLGLLIRQPVPVFPALLLMGQATVGMAGGGGVDVGDSVISETFIGLAWSLSKQLEITVQSGHVQALSPEAFHSPVVLIGLQMTPEIPIQRR